MFLMNKNVKAIGSIKFFNIEDRRLETINSLIKKVEITTSI